MKRDSYLDQSFHIIYIGPMSQGSLLKCTIMTCQSQTLNLHLMQVGYITFRGLKAEVLMSSKVLDVTLEVIRGFPSVS